MLNRAAILIRMKEPAVRWINEMDPSPKSHKISIESANEECTIYLVSDEDGDGDIAVENWVKQNYKVLFEDELFGWYTDPSLWPSNLTYKMFKEWFKIETQLTNRSTMTKYNKSLKFVPALRASTGRLTAPLN